MFCWFYLFFFFLPVLTNKHVFLKGYFFHSGKIMPDSLTKFRLLAIYGAYENGQEAWLHGPPTEC